MALPNPLFVASPPLQYIFIDKDLGELLSAGVVKFFSDPEFTTPKNVYELTNNPDNSITFTSIGAELTLSSIGTFVDNSGENLTPYYYPWENNPSNSNPGDEELYFIEVYNSSGVLQFTLNDWPPNSLSGGSSTSFQESLTNNLITNPGFSVVNFTVPPSSSTFSYSVSGSSTFPVAPGWNIVATGTGTIQVSQESLNVSVPSEGPYALQIIWSTGLTSLSLVQTITNSPRIIAGSAASASMVVNSPNGQGINIQAHYVASSGGIDVELFNKTTSQQNIYETFAGTEPIPTTSTADASGYVNFVIQFGALNTGGEIRINSIQLVEVGNEGIIADYIQQTTADELNGLMWYYEPQLAAKPIPYYTLGWNFPFNPCQELGTTVTVANMNLGAVNKSRYIADQTIAFQAVDDSLSFSFSTATGLTAATANTTQWALVQYLDTPTARELLKGNLAVKIKGNTTGAVLTGYVNMYWNANATLPTITSPTFNSLIATMTSGQAATFNSPGTWNKVPRGGLGDAPFSLPLTTSAEFNFSGWDASGEAGINAASYFAIVVSFAAMPASTGVAIEYITLCAGDIATEPAPMNKAQTLSALQYYYEQSYDPGRPATIATTTGAVYAQAPLGFDGTNTNMWCPDIYLQFKQSKVANPALTFYSTDGTIGTIKATMKSGSTNIQSPVDVVIGNWSQTISLANAVLFSLLGTGVGAQHTGFVIGGYGELLFQYVADARLGTF